MTNTCGYCGDPIPEGVVSDDFCSPGHQDLWHRGNSVPLDSEIAYQRWLEQARRDALDATSALARIGEVMGQLRGAIAETGTEFARVGDSGQPPLDNEGKSRPH